MHNLCLLGNDLGEWLEPAAPDPADPRDDAAASEPESQQPVDEPAGDRRRQAMIRHLRTTRQ